MPNRTPVTSANSGSTPDKNRPMRLLVVDDDTQIGQQMSGCFDADRFHVVQVGTMAEALKLINSQTMDLVMIEADLPDGSGLALARRMRRTDGKIHTIVMTAQPSVQRAIDVIRLGAADLLLKPLDLDEVRQRVDRAVGRLRADRKQRRRVKRLRRMCKQLNQARDEIAHQVDILCNDLVIAYQDLAQQVQLLAQTSEYGALIRQELDLETLLRRTLEYLLQKAGPTNGAIFLPASTDPDEYSLGGYVNYECTSESAEILLQHLADVLAPKMVEHQWPVHITDHTTLTQWLGDDFSYLADSHVLAFPCRHEDDTLAVVVLFRHNSQEFNGSLIQACTSIAPILAQSLARVVSIHHRIVSDGDEDQGPSLGLG